MAHKRNSKVSHNMSDSGWQPFKDILNEAFNNPSIIPPAPVYEHIRINFESCLGKLDISDLYNDLYNNVTNEDEYNNVVEKWLDVCPELEASYEVIFEDKYDDYESFKRFIEIHAKQPFSTPIINLLYYYFFGELRDYEEFKEQYIIMDAYAILSGIESMLTVPFYFDNYPVLIDIILTSTILISALMDIGINLPRNFFIDGIMLPEMSTNMIKNSDRLIQSLKIDVLADNNFDPEIPDFDTFVEHLNDIINDMLDDKDENNSFLRLYNAIKENFGTRIRNTLPEQYITKEKYLLLEKDDIELASEYFIREEPVDMSNIIEQISDITIAPIPIATRSLRKKTRKPKISKKKL